MPTGNTTDIRYQRRTGGQVSDKPPQYSPASWKGLVFYCDSSSDEFGRRQDIYEYPLSDEVALKDMGRKARRFKVEGFLIGAGADQIKLTREMATKAEDPDPGTLVHPIHGEQRVSCITLTMTADYRKDKKRTRLSWEFVEAKQSQQPSRVSESPNSVFNTGSQAVDASKELGQANWFPGTLDKSAIKEFSNLPLTPTNEQSWDAVSMTQRGSVMFATQSVMFGATPAVAQALLAPIPALESRARAATGRAISVPYAYGLRVVSQPAAFRAIVDPIDYAAALIRVMYIDALERLKDYNLFVVQKTQQLAYTASARALVITIRLIIAREMAVAMTQRDYPTVKAALDDLDLIMAIYDEEEADAAKHCEDVLVVAIRRARAMAAEVILARNIRKPGVTEFPVDGLWPSLVVAHKLYANGQRFKEVEDYNPTMLNFWMGRYVVGPSR